MNFYLGARSLIEVLTQDESNNQFEMFQIDNLVINDGEHIMVARCNCYDLYRALQLTTKYDALFKADKIDHDKIDICLYPGHRTSSMAIRLKEPSIHEISIADGDDYEIQVKLTIKYKGITHEYAK